MKDAPEDFIDPPPEDKDRMTYEDFLELLASCNGVVWGLNKVRSLRDLKTKWSPLQIIGWQMIGGDNDIWKHDYLVFEALNVAKEDAEKIMAAINVLPRYNQSVRKDLLRACGLLMMSPKKARPA